MKKKALFLFLTLMAINGFSAQAADINYTYTIEVTFAVPPFVVGVDPLGLGSNSAKAIINFTLNSNQIPIQQVSGPDWHSATYNANNITLKLKYTNSDGNYIADSSLVSIFNSTKDNFLDQVSICSNFKLSDGNNYTFGQIIILPTSFYKDSENPPLPKSINQKDASPYSTGAINNIENGSLYQATDVKINAIKVAKKVYGVLIGSEHVTPWGQTKDIIVRCDLGAEKVSNAFLNLPNYYRSILLTRKMVDGGVKKNDLKSTIEYLKSLPLKEGDGLILYVNCHGAKYISPSSQATYILCTGSERNISCGCSETDIDINIINQYPDDYITDIDLKEMLSGMDNIQKWIIIDSCHSGGFYNSIHSLMNASLVASTTEDLLSWGYDFSTGMVKGGLFTGAFCDGFSRKSNGKLLMDGYHSTLNPERVYPEDGIVTFEEIVNYVEDYNQKTDVNGRIVYELNIGNPAVFTMDKWNPTGYRTADFLGGFSTNHQSISPMLLLLTD